MNTKKITVLLLVILASFSHINNTLCGCQQIRTHALSMMSRIFSSLSTNKTKIAVGALTIGTILYGIKKSYWKNNHKLIPKSGDPQEVNFDGKKLICTVTVEK